MYFFLCLCAANLWLILTFHYYTVYCLYYFLSIIIILSLYCHLVMQMVQTEPKLVVLWGGDRFWGF